ncbi:barstar family protein [Lentzea sp. NPDC051838]|uniref:barstar family protein n=1 Tax=Lentzea sp. NPDC051838 TaxID=3154849 RepID=UPI0034249A18
MSLADLLKPGPPSFHLTSATSEALGEAISALSSDSAVVRRIRGTRCRTVDGWFDELSAALQFPSYFGSNWPALEDMLTDLSWLPADGYLLVFEDAEDLLADELPEALTLALTILGEAAEEFAPIPYQFLLQAPGDGRIAKALSANGTAYATFAL